MAHEDVVTELLLRWEEQPSLTPEELCQEYQGHPDHAALLEAVQQGIRALKAAAQLLDTTPEEDNSAPGPQPPRDPATWTAPGLRYRPLGFHAKGGLGEVFRAHDEELHREVALKRLQERHRGDAESHRRFLREAEITARLQHPGIVPVYGLGQDGDGRLCYAMRFVEGDTLADALKRFHEADQQPGRDAGERSLALRELLGRFVTVCRTVAYAHGRGVIHRDLKPGNVLLGDYGETLVVDWGLAKPFKRPQAEQTAGEDAPIAPGGPTEDGTHVGQAMGTPAYMSPEQAQGHWDVVGPASDIYSLGATLYAVLTGEAPFKGGVAEILAKVKRGDFLAPRQVKRTCPGALEAICLKAMAAKPEARYATALDLAADVEHWLADEPVAAWREPLPARLGRWVRRHKALVAGTAALVLTGLLLGGSNLLWLRWQRMATAQEVGEQLKKAEDVLKGIGDPAEALQALEHAEGRLAAGGPGHLRVAIERLRQDVALIAQLDDARLQRSLIGASSTPKATGPAGEDFDYAGADHLYAQAFAGHDLGIDMVDAEEAARRISASVLRARLTAALDDWAYVKDQLRRGDGEPLRAVAQLIDDDRWRQRLRKLEVRRNPVALEELARGEEILTQLPENVELLSVALVAARKRDAAVSLLRLAQQRHPTDFWINFHLATFLEPKNPTIAEERIGFYRAALAQRPRSPVAFYNLGLALQPQGKLDEAVHAQRQAIALEPRFAAAYNGLGVAYYSQGKLAEALDAYRQALAMKHDFAAAHSNLGAALADQGRLDEALQAYDKAIALQPGYAPAYYNRGNALQKQSKLVEAVKAYRQAIDRKADFAAVYYSLGNALQAQRQMGAAVEAYHQAITRKPDFPEAHYNLGNALHGQNQPAQAVKAYRQAVALKPDYALAYYNLGKILHDQGKLEEAVQAYRQAILHRPDQALAYTNLSIALGDQGKVEEAVTVLREAITRQPDFALAHYNLGLTLGHLGRFTDALKFLQRSQQLGYPSAEWISNTQQMIDLDSRLAKVIRDEAKPANAKERIGFAELCKTYRHLYAASARLYEEAFTDQPGLADDASDDRITHRYSAACAAALAGCGQGEDAAKLDSKERTRLRQQALTWLRADLAVSVKSLEDHPAKARDAVLEQMQSWQKDADLAGVRERSALVLLPEVERQQWHKLWDEVEELRQRLAVHK
jgi:tetratricopeptide (TPR) repeat protein/tRNA A-37 threonylcarbamoyl transferase component Bud32